MKPTGHQLLIFSTVEGVGMLFDYALSATLHEQGCPLPVASMLAFAAGFALRFAGNFRWTFRGQDAEFAPALTRYAAVAFARFALRPGAFGAFPGLLEETYDATRIGWILLEFGLGFVVSKYWAFRISMKGGQEW
ncbi:putative flippase GtrA [Haloferula luteola]|uniref:Putative flippase GtrA n=1 Tax=Haloferula luteola TaxID=595692 RepID=A0A840VAF4_9BACT|nr:GtrA family protein [Haloferula luteola]MBB5350769.1 putative flippase GtrA [Haloferula luteola]